MKYETGDIVLVKEMAMEDDPWPTRELYRYFTFMIMYPDMDSKYPYLRGIIGDGYVAIMLGQKGIGEKRYLLERNIIKKIGHDDRLLEFYAETDRISKNWTIVGEVEAKELKKEAEE